MSEKFPKWASSEISAQLPSVREAGESTNVDFKESFPDQAHRLAKEIAAMATSGGGRIFIGINDNGDLHGLDASNGDARDDIAERAHSISLTVNPIPNVNLFFAVESEKTVLVVDVPKQSDPVYYYDLRPYVRDERRARPAEPDEVVDLVWAHPSSEHKKEMERMQQQQMQHFIDHNRELDRMSADQMRDFSETMNALTRTL